MCYEHLLLSLSRAELFHRFVESNLLRLSALQATEKQEETLNSKENGKKSDAGGHTRCCSTFSHVLPCAYNEYNAWNAYFIDWYFCGT